MAVKRDYAEVNGTRLYYEIAGSGHPLCLIHGFGMDTQSWDYQFDALVKDYQVFRYDLRGFGKSSPPTDETYAPLEDLQSLINYLGFETAYILGHSLGGFIAIDFALTHAETTSSLILADPAVGGFQWSKEVAEAFFVLPHKAANESGVSSARDALLHFPGFLPAMENPRAAPLFRRMITDYSGWHWFHENPVRSLDPPALPRLGEINIPTLIVLGAENSSDHHKVAEVINHGIKDSQLVLIPEAGHVLQLEAPESFMQTVSDFLRTIQAT